MALSIKSKFHTDAMTAGALTRVFGAIGLGCVAWLLVYWAA
jgi:hypothetical protein